MKSIISIIFAMFCIGMSTTVGSPLIKTDFAQIKERKFKRSRGKGRGKPLYFTKYF